MMKQARPARSRRSRRWFKWAVAVFIAVGLMAGGAGLYRYQKERNTDHLLKEAGEAVEREDWDQAIVGYRQYVRRRPDDQDALKTYADVLLEGMSSKPDRVGDTVRMFERLVSVQPDNVDAMAKLAGLYLRLREFPLALDLAKRWSALAPDSVDATLMAARAQVGSRDDPAAIDTLRRALDRSPNESRFYALLIGLLARDPERAGEAEQRLPTALEVGADNPDVQLAAALYYQDRARPAQAEECLHQALDLAPESVDVLLAGAWFFLSADRHEDARLLLDRAERLAPRSRPVLLARGRWATITGDTKVLVETVDRLTDPAEKPDLNLLLQAAEMYLVAGRLDRADECLTAVESAPDRPDELRARLLALKGARALDEGRPFAALPHLRASLALQPSDLRATRLLAEAHRQSGDLDATADDYARLRQLAPESVEIRLAAAELAWRQGQIRRVREMTQLPPQAPKAQRDLADLIELACALRERRTAGVEADEPPLSSAELQRLTIAGASDAASAAWGMRCLFWAGRPDLARALLGNNFGRDRVAVDLGAELGGLLLAEGQTEQALNVADELIDRFPDRVEGHVLKVRGLASVQQWADAEAHIAEVGLPTSQAAKLTEVLADAYLSAGRIEQAAQAYRTAMTAQPAAVPPREKLIRITDDLGEAVQRSDEIREIEGDAGLHWRIATAAALLRLDPGDESRTRARRLLKECVAERPRWTAARLLLGYVHELEGSLPQAVDAYRTALSQQPELGREQVAVRLVDLLMRLGRFAEAETLVNSLAESFPNEPGLLRLRAKQQWRQGDFDSALVTAERLLAVEPDAAAWATVAVDLHLRLGNAADAGRVAEEALVRFPGSTAVLWSAARTLLAQNRIDDAEAMLREAATQKQNAPQLILLAQFLATIDRAAEAKSVIERAVHLAPEDAAVWAAAADFWGAVGRRDRQLACVRKSLRLRGEEPGESLALARLLAEGDDEERRESQAIVRLRLDRRADDAPALVLAARLAMSGTLPDLAEAESNLQRALSVDPRLAEAQNLLARVQLAWGRVQSAQETISAGLALHPNDPDLLMTAAQTHSTLGNYERALHAAQKLLVVRPRLPQALRLAAESFRKLGQLDQGLTYVADQAPEDSRSPEEAVILARLYEDKRDFERAEALFQDAVSRSGGSDREYHEWLSYLGRRERFDDIHRLALERRETRGDDVQSLIVAGESLGSQARDRRLRDVGLGWLDEVARSDPPHAVTALYRSAICHYNAGEHDRAEARFLEALDRAPDSTKIVNDLSWLYAQDTGRPEMALTLIEKYLAAGGVEDAHLADTHGLALLRAGRPEAAEEKFNHCLGLAGDPRTRAAATYHLGLAMLATGRESAGRANVLRAIEFAEFAGGLTPDEMAEARILLAADQSVSRESGPED